MKNRLDLFQCNILRKIFRARPFQFIVQAPNVLIFILVILTGLLGSQIPGKNFATVLTWTIWWAGIIFLILFAGAAWCLICPWMALGNWVQRLAFWRKSESGPGLEKKYGFARNRYPAVIFFFIVSALELGILITYSPMYTALLAVVMFVLAVTTALIWEKNAFCRYICFVGAIVGMYSNLSPVEIRSRDKEVCGGCKTKDCVTGNDKGYGCPTFLYPGGLEMNTDCTLCAECFKTCPYDNMTLNVRPFLSDLSGAFKGRMDEAVLALVLLGLTVFHGVTMLPKWFFWATESLKGEYAVYLFSFLLAQTAFALGPLLIHAIFSQATVLIAGTREIKFKEVFIRFSYSFLPVAIAYHLAHNLAHIRKEGYKFFLVLSDPFGWGWDLFGTAGWIPPVSHAGHAMKKTPASEHSGHDMSGHEMSGHDTGTHDMPAVDHTGHDMSGHDMSTHDMSGHDMAGHDMSTHEMPATDMPADHMGHDMPMPEMGADMSTVHEMASQSGIMLHQAEFSYYNVTLITLGLMGGLFLVRRAAKEIFKDGAWRGAVFFLLAITAYSYLSWFLLNQPMVMRTQ